jgi:hypothetical protein
MAIGAGIVVGSPMLLARRIQETGNHCSAFFSSAFAAMWPWLAKDAPYSFWIFACLLWFLSPFVYGLIAIAFR